MLRRQNLWWPRLVWAPIAFNLLRGGPLDFWGGGVGDNWFAQDFFFSLACVFLFTVKAEQEIFSQIFNTLPPPLKSQMVRPLLYTPSSLLVGTCQPISYHQFKKTPLWIWNTLPNCKYPITLWKEGLDFPYRSNFSTIESNIFAIKH